MTPAQLTDARLALHLSQADLARTLGVASNTVNRWEAGARTIPTFLGLALDGIEYRRQCDGTGAEHENERLRTVLEQIAERPSHARRIAHAALVRHKDG